jgi:hypothetical protein
MKNLNACIFYKKTIFEKTKADLNAEFVSPS